MTQTPAPTTEATSESEKLAGQLLEHAQWNGLNPKTPEICKRAASLITQQAAEIAEARRGAELVAGLLDKAVRENAGLLLDRDDLRRAIFGGSDYDPSLRNGNFVEMADTTESARLGAIARAEASESREAALLEKVRVMGGGAGAVREIPESPWPSHPSAR